MVHIENKKILLIKRTSLQDYIHLQPCDRHNFTNDAASNFIRDYAYKNGNEIYEFMNRIYRKLYI